ncbi:hypothetical protein OESDEN_00578 [Oesophagostomum dentatum]|uniref:Uncharacterized protein n=1 Tax=Oesophagostomum dentatum TaxID=61180 RepID=A0A0B1TVF1_OESDE|nr:hypothetical protein OESDEN_00578 [Oesophagostomum dentatum]
MAAVGWRRTRVSGRRPSAAPLVPRFGPIPPLRGGYPCSSGPRPDGGIRSSAHRRSKRSTGNVHFLSSGIASAQALCTSRSCASRGRFIWQFSTRRAFSTGFQLTAASLITVCLAMLSFTLCSSQYQRFYMPTSFLCTFLICLVTLLIFSSDSKSAFMTPVASLATSFQLEFGKFCCSLLCKMFPANNASFKVVLLIYTVIPLPLYLCILIGVVYSCLFETLSRNRVAYGDLSHIQLVLHIGVHLLGVHLFILTQVSQ